MLDFDNFAFSVLSTGIDLKERLQLARMVGEDAGAWIGGAAAETGGQQVFPFRRGVLWVTLIFFLILAIVGTIESFQQHSIEPLLSRTVLKVVASDRLLGATAEKLATHQAPEYTGVLNKSFPVFLWYWLTTFFDVVGSLYFIFFFGICIYWLFGAINNTSPLRNVLLTVGTYAVLTFMVSTVLFMADNAGRQLPTDKNEAIKVWALQSYPFQGISKLVMYFVAQDTLKGIADWTENGGVIPSIITNIPQGNSSLGEMTNDSFSNTT